jgi:hypothetical protein
VGRQGEGHGQMQEEGGGEGLGQKEGQKEGREEGQEERQEEGEGLAVRKCCPSNQILGRRWTLHTSTFP